MQLDSCVSKVRSRVLRHLTLEPLRPARRVGRWPHHDLQDIQTGGYNTVPALLTTYKTQLQCEVIRQDDAIPLTLREKHTAEMCPHEERRRTDHVSLSSRLAFSVEHVYIYGVPMICHNGECRVTSQLF
jgi:hypothetical protein